MRTWRLARCMPLLAMMAAPAPAGAQMQDTLLFEYAVKVVCGRPALQHGHTQPPFANGTYYTLVNVHNPAPQGFLFRFKVAYTQTQESQGTISEFERRELGPDGALRIDCDRIRRLAGPPPPALGAFLDGFLVIQSPMELDVVAVYTAGHGTGAAMNAPPVSTMHTERVDARRTFFTWCPNC